MNRSNRGTIREVQSISTSARNEARAKMVFPFEWINLSSEETSKKDLVDITDKILQFGNNPKIVWDLSFIDNQNIRKANEKIFKVILLLMIELSEHKLNRGNRYWLLHPNYLEIKELEMNTKYSMGDLVYTEEE